MDKQEYIDLYREMVVIRRLEERAAELYQKGKIGGFLHLYIGQEAVCAGVDVYKRQVKKEKGFDFPQDPFKPVSYTHLLKDLYWANVDAPIGLPAQAEMARVLLETGKPVSYTHLDVYKRQATACQTPECDLHRLPIGRETCAHTVQPGTCSLEFLLICGF